MYNIDKARMDMLKHYQKVILEKDSKQIDEVYNFACLLLANIFSVLSREDQCDVWKDIPITVKRLLPHACVARRETKGEK